MAFPSTLKRVQSATDVPSTEVDSSSSKPKRQKTEEEVAAKAARNAAKKLNVESYASPEREKAVAVAPAATDSADAVATFLKSNEITIHDSKAPPPCISLASAPFPAPLVQLLQQQGFATPSAVQGASWPIAMSGNDVLAVAKTGSGKTLGYLLPAISLAHGKWAKAAGKPLALVMAPTRELALQIKSEATKFGAPLQIRAVAVYGGDPKWKQIQELERGCEIIIATPGRMMDMLDLHGKSYSGAATSLDACEMLILDEADRMLDMGFEKDIRSIVAAMPATRQTFLFTATWPKAVQRVASDLLGPSQVKVTVGSGGEKLTANKAVVQNINVVSAGEKWAAFVKLIESHKPGGVDADKRCIIFANTKRDVNGIGQHTWENGYSVDTLSGDRSQRERESVLQRFRSGQVMMVIATDVAARGLDVSGIERVINYDYPPGDGGSEDYIHRIGRTGRAGAMGIADTFFTQADAKHARELVRILSDAGQQVPAELDEMAQRSGGGGKGGRKGGGKGWGKGGGKGGGKGYGRW